MDPSPAFQRAPQAPRLPATPLRFIAYFIGRYRWWYLAMVLLEAVNSTCGILMPYATGQIIKAVTGAHERSQPLFDSLTRPLVSVHGGRGAEDRRRLPRPAAVGKR